MNIKRVLIVAGLAALTLSDAALAQRRGGGGRGGGGRGGGGFRGGGGGGFRGGGGGFSRAAARPSVSRPSMPSMSRPSAPSISRPSTPNISRPSTPAGGAIANRPGAGGGGVQRPGNLPSNRPGGGGNNIINNRPNRPPINTGDINVGNGSHWDPDYGCCHGYGWGAAAAGAAVGYAVGASYGSTVYALPSGCVTTVVGGVTYQQCGSTWYQPTFVGDDTGYVVVSPPQ
jgi:hypothetical protein